MWPTNLGSADFATKDLNGAALPKNQRVNPIQLFFRPVAKLPDQEVGAQTCDLESKALLSLSSIPVGSVIWNVEGSEKILDITKRAVKSLSDPIPIGQIILTSPIIKSQFAD